MTTRTGEHPPLGVAEADEAISPKPVASRLRGKTQQLVSRFGLLGAWALLTLVYIGLEPDLFLRYGTFRSIFATQQPLVFLALAMICTMVVGELDISVAGTLGLCAMLVTVLNVDHGVGVLEASLLAIFVAAVVGAVNGGLVVFARVNPIIATLGMMTLLIGIAGALSDNRPIAGLPRSFSRIATSEFLGMPVSFWYGIALALIIGYIVSVTPFGRNLSFVGDNAEVARLAGIRVTAMKFGAFIVGAVIAGVGGVLLAASSGGFDSSTAVGYLLPAAAAAFLSTTVFIPGRFNPIGALVAIYFLVTGIVGLQLMGYTGWIADVFYGGALIVSVTVASIARRAPH